jgi:hypothetical protein
MNITFSVIFGVLFAALLTVELIGVFRKEHGDTITENWRWINKHSPAWVGWAWRVLTIGLLGWVLLHFAVGIS